MNVLRRIPVPTAALALSLASLGNALGAYSPALKTTCGALSAAFALLLLGRVLLDARGVLAELKSPAALSVVPAFFMALMLLATYLKPVAGTAAFALWAAALALQLAVVAWFVVRFVVRLDLATVMPSWFLVAVGYVVASVTAPAFGAARLGAVLAYAGIIGYALALPLVVYRLVKLGDLPAPARPTHAIFAAPASLCVVGYLATAQIKQPAVVLGLLALSAASMVYLLVRLPGILRAPFVPGLASITFPSVITAIAFRQSGVFLGKTGSSLAPLVTGVTPVLLGIAVAAVAYVLVRYVVFLAMPAAPAVQMQAQPAEA